MPCPSFAVLFVAGAAFAEPHEGIALYGDLKYKPGFTHFDYTNPDAPKGGAVKFNAIGTYDTFNPYTLKGVKAEGLGYLFDTLMVAVVGRAGFAIWAGRAKRRGRAGSSVGDVSASSRGAVPRRQPDHAGRRDLDLRHAESERCADLSPLLRRRAEGRNRSASAASNSRCARRRIANCRLILGELPVLSKKYWAKLAISKKPRSSRRSAAGLTSSIHSIPGRSITYRPRGGLLGARICRSIKGRFNFGTIRYDYYRDASVALEAFKAGAIRYSLGECREELGDRLCQPRPVRGPVQESDDQEPGAAGHAGFRLQHAPAAVPGPAGARGAGLSLRFRMGQQESVLRRLYPHRELFFQFRSRVVGVAQRRRAEDSRARCKSEIPAAVFTKVYEAPKTDGTGDIRAQYPRRAGPAEGGGLDGEGRQARQRQRRADSVRIPQRRGGVRARPFALRQQSAAHRHRHESAHRRSGAIREPPQQLRLRHDGDRRSGIAVARQRAARLLDLGRGRRAGRQQCDGGEKQGGRQAGRSHHRVARPAEPRWPGSMRSTACCSKAFT